jgi:hypothetical protein
VSLAERLSTVAPVAPKAEPLAVIDFENQTGTVVSKAQVASEDYRRVVEETTGYVVPPGQDVVLERMTIKVGEDGSKHYWYKFKFVERPLHLSEERESLAELRAWLRKQKPPKPKKSRKGGAAALNIADLQLGKTDRRGGTKETVESFHDGVEQMVGYVRRHGCRTAVLTELGDGVENFQNTPTQAQTNDRSLIEQLDLHAELISHAAVQISKEVEHLTVLGVPSNHMEVREDGNAVGGPHNDYGLLTLANLKRSFALNPAAFSHVDFVWPADHEVSVTIDLNGVPVGFTHGHYARGAGAANNVEKWLLGQFAGNHPLQPAHIIVSAHFHHLRVQNIIGGRWWFQAPTSDRGSSWLERSTGQGSSQNGFLAFRIQDGASSWSDLELLRTA